MTIFFAIVAVLAIAFTMFVLVKNKKLEVDLFRVQKEAQASIADSQSSANQLVTVAQQEAQASIAEAQVSADRRVTVAQQEAQVSVAEAQKLIDQQMTAIQQEGERIRQYYEAESRNVQEAANAVLAKTIKEFEPLRKYETLREAEAEAQRQLADALEAARSLRAEAQNLLAQTKDAAADQRLAAEEKVKDIHEQADARLNQAIRDAGSIITRAEERAKQIGGDAYRALQEKDQLAEAAEAIRNKIEGYGDRYLVPAHSVLDDLADKFGYDAAGQALKSARALSARMVEHGEAATCDYAEANRRKTAVQFVIHAFNGEVDSVLSKVMTDNSGTLAQKIRDAFRYL